MTFPAVKMAPPVCRKGNSLIRRTQPSHAFSQASSETDFDPTNVEWVMKKIINVNHAPIELMNIVIMITGSIVGVAYITELFIAWYSGVEYEQYAFLNRATGPYWWAYWSMMTCNVFSPQFMWFKKLRTSIMFSFVISIVVNIGMWFERFVIIVTSLHRDYLPSSWTMFSPTFVDIGVFIGTLGFFFVLFLLYARTFPVIAQAEVKTILKSSGENYKKLRDKNE